MTPHTCIKTQLPNHFNKRRKRNLRKSTAFSAKIFQHHKYRQNVRHYNEDLKRQAHSQHHAETGRAESFSLNIWSKSRLPTLHLAKYYYWAISPEQVGEGRGKRDSKTRNDGVKSLYSDDMTVCI